MKTKIVATAGPSLSSEGKIEDAIKAGVSVFRLNFSHGTHDSHRRLIETIRRVSQKVKREVAILQDLSGPKLRVGRLSSPVKVEPGDTLWLVQGEEASGTEIPINYSYLIDDVKEGETILIEDGKIALEVIERVPGKLRAKVITGGVIRSEKGVNLPDSDLRIPSFTEKDRRDLEFGVENNVDLVALSFVKSPDDVKGPKEIAGDDIPIIAKIERKEAIKRLGKIIDSFDGIMVARGDLGVELPLEKVPVLQKKMIAIANKWRKIVITATQMLSTMIDNPYPTRAEVSDIANAVFDGSDALMLSGETAIGKYPIEAVEMMKRAIEEVEKSELLWSHRRRLDWEKTDPTEALAESAVITAEKIGASAVVVFTASGKTAQVVSKFRPRMSLIALTHSIKVQRIASIFWGVHAEVVEFVSNTDRMIEQGISMLTEKGLLRRGDFIVLTAGKTPMRGATDMVKVLKV